MNFDAVIGQIKAAAPVFSGNVAGAAGYARAIEDQAWLPMPAAYVVPTDEEPAENDEAPGLFQLVRERFEVIVIFDNTADRRGQSVTATYESTKAQLFAAILNWRPESTADNPLIQPGDPNANRSAKGLSYAGGTLVNFDRARLFYSWSFALQTAISDADGWQPPSDPLAHILLTTPVTGEGNVNWTVGTVSDVAFDQSFPVPSPPLPFGPSPTLPATPDAATLAAALATETAARAAADATASAANTAFTQAAIVGRLTGGDVVSVAGNTQVTLTAAQAAPAIVVFGGTLTGSISVVFPVGVVRSWLVVNRTTGAFTITCRPQNGNGILVAQSATTARNLWCDGTEIYGST